MGFADENPLIETMPMLPDPCQPAVFVSRYIRKGHPPELYLDGVMHQTSLHEACHIMNGIEP